MKPWFSVSFGDLDRGFIAGLLEGDGCFVISEQNGGQSYSCRSSLRLRDDDQALLEWLLAVTGIGRLYRVPARGTSRPQVAWHVDSQEECQELLGLIGDSGFHGRRASELVVWRRAVDVWTTTRGEERRRALSVLQTRLRQSKRFGGGAPAAVPFTRRAERLGYISGLVCAEGSFLLSTGRPRFSMHLRADDRSLLEMLAATTEVGSIGDYVPAPPLNPSSGWTVSGASQLQQLIELFDWAV